MSETGQEENLENERAGLNDQSEDLGENQDIALGEVPVADAPAEEKAEVPAEETGETGSEADAEVKTAKKSAYRSLLEKILNPSKIIWEKGKSFLVNIVPSAIRPFFSRRKKAVFVILALVLTSSIAVFSSLLGKKDQVTSGLSCPSENRIVGTETKTEKYRLKPFLVPFSQGGTDIFLRLEIDLVTEKDAAVKIKGKELVLREAIYAFFLSKNLDSVQQGQTDHKIGDKLRQALNEYLGQEMIREVSFVNYVFT